MVHGRSTLHPMRSVPVLLIAALAACGGGAFAMNALDSGGGQRAPRLSISPARQTAAPGERVTFSVDVPPGAAATTLRVASLPSGLRAFFRLNDGRPGRVVPAGQDGAILTVVSSRRIRLGRKRIVVAAESAGRSHRQAVGMTLRLRSRALRVRPARLTLLPGGSGSYAVRAWRARWLWVRGLPPGVRASWTRSRGRSRLMVTAGAGMAPVSRRMVFFALDRRVQRTAAVVLNVSEGQPFGIAGDLGPLLFPGRAEPLDLRLTNPNDFTIKVVELSVAIRPGTPNAGCDVGNYAVEQYRGPYPLTLPPGTRSLADLVSDRSLWPQVAMRNLDTNQDACKGARIALDYRGTAVR
jgi:hypothetical protein